MSGNGHGSIALGLLLAGCPAASEDDGAEDDVPPEVEEIEIAGELQLTSSCVELDAGEQVVSISPEGHAWLNSGQLDQFEVVDSEGVGTEVVLAHDAEFLQAWDASRISYIAEGELWQADVVDGFAEPSAWPTTVDPPSSFCGDPALDGDGFVVAGAALLQRDAGLWWRWQTPDGADFGPIAVLGSSYGACVDRQGALWLASEAGEVWRVSGDDARVVTQLPGATRLVFDDAFGTAGLVDGNVIYGSVADGDEGGWFIPRIPEPGGSAAPVMAIAASRGRLWVAISDGILAFDGETWLEVLAEGEPVGGVTEASLWGDAEGIWVERGGQLCRLAEVPAVELEGVRPLERILDPLLAFEVLGPGAVGAASLRVLLDGTLVAEHDGGPLPWVVEAFDLGEPGWHLIEVETDAGNVARRLDVELRSPIIGTWLEDVQPLAELHCTAINGCHDPEGAGDKPVLSEYSGWVENAEAIQARVGLTGDMPPLASRLESWDAEEVGLIMAWIDAGMPMGVEGP